MKYIIKGEEPVEFTNWKNNGNQDWTPYYDNLSGNEKLSVYNSLLNEQGFICCYCERELVNNDFHIEHLNPQTLEVVNPLEYANMLCSCQRHLKKGEPLHCGNKKDEWYEEEYFITPLNQNCEGYFKYTSDGYILPSDENNVAASTTIKKLGLDIDKLNALRHDAIEPFIDDNLTMAELTIFINGYLVAKENNDGKYNEFFTTIRYLFGN